MRFNIIIRGRNCERYIKKCLQSIVSQSVTGWRAIVILDAPDDNSVSQAMSFINEKMMQNQIYLKVNKEQKGLGYNIYHGPYWLDKKWKILDGDILAWVDADDMLNTNDALSIVEGKYRKHPNCVLTYGSYIKMTKKRKTKISKAYDPSDDVRKAPWHGSHLKSMLWGLFRQLPRECFMHKDRWAPAASDVALMLPAMEVAGLPNCYHVSSPVYIWRDNYDGSTLRGRQRKYDKIIRKKKPLKVKK